MDAVARIVTRKLADVLGKPFIVENRGGANGNIGAAAAASAPADGYTLLFTTTGPLVYNRLIYRSTAFDPAKDFAPIVKVSAIPLVVVANASVPVKTIAELVAYVKANPGKLSYASPGTGSMGRLVAELVQSDLGIQLTHVPYAGSAPAMNDLLGGTVNLSFDLLPTYTEHIRSGTLKALAVTTRVAPRSFPTQRPWPNRACRNSRRSPGPRCSDPPALRRKRSRRSTASSTNFSQAMRANGRCSISAWSRWAERPKISPASWHPN